MFLAEIDDELSDAQPSFIMPDRECGTCWLEDCTWISRGRTTDFIALPPYTQ